MKRHPFRWEALIFGVVFLAVVGTWLSRTLGLFDPDEWAWVVAGTLIAVGIAGIVSSVATPRTPVPAPTQTETATGDEPAPQSSSSH